MTVTSFLFNKAHVGVLLTVNNEACLSWETVPQQDHFYKLLTNVGWSKANMLWDDPLDVVLYYVQLKTAQIKNADDNNKLIFKALLLT